MSVRNPTELTPQAPPTGQRRLGLRTTTPRILRPTTWGSRPRRVVSTSGSSGMDSLAVGIRRLYGSSYKATNETATRRRRTSNRFIMVAARDPNARRFRE